MKVPRRLRLSLGLVAAVSLVGLLAAMQPTRTSAATGENAVVYWSGVAETAIAAGMISIHFVNVAGSPMSKTK